MATITVITKERVTSIIEPAKQQIGDDLVTTTAKSLNRNPTDIIVDFNSWGNPESANAPDVLIRAETSPHRRPLLESWGRSLLDRWNLTVTDLGLQLPADIRVAVKPYVIDSVWIEDKP